MTIHYVFSFPSTCDCFCAFPFFSAFVSLSASLVFFFFGRALSLGKHFLSKGILATNNAVCVFTRGGRTPNASKKHVTVTRTHRKRGKRWATAVTPCLSWAGAVGKTRLLCRFRRLIRLLHGPGPWRAALPFSKGVWHNGFVPSFHCVSVKHICSMTLQVYPSCEPSTPFLFLLPLNLRSSRQPRVTENYAIVCV